MPISYKANGASAGRPISSPPVPSQAAIVEPPVVDAIERSSNGLRAMLFDTIDRLRRGDCTVNEAKAVAVLSGQIINTVHMEIAVATLRKNHPEDANSILPPALGLIK